MKIAYFSPLGPQRTGVADYSEELLPHLAKYADIDLFVDGYTPTSQALVRQFPTHDYRDFTSLRRSEGYDVSLYQMGNSPFHQYIYRTLAEFPGVTVLHEHVLHHMVVEMTVGQGDEASYIREMGYCHGLEGADAAKLALRGANRFPYLQYPANSRVIDASLGLIVHSEYLRSLVATSHPTTPVARIPHLLFPTKASPEDCRDIRRSLGIGSDSLLLASFGFATPDKRLDVAIRAFRRLREQIPESRYLIIGQVPPWYDLQSTIVEHGLGEAVQCIGYVSKEDLPKFIAAVDVAICLRWPTIGETSGSLIRFLSMGKPAIVSDVGSYAELRDDCCLKVAVGENEEERLFQAMMTLGLNREKRAEMGNRAASYVREHHDPDRSAAEYIRFLEKVLSL